MNQLFSQLNSSDYLNARYAPTGDETVGTPFLAFRMTGSRFTQWSPVALSASTFKKQMNLPTDNTLFRQGQTQDAIGIGNRANNQWVTTTQTLANPSADTQFCTSDADCMGMGPNYTCNSNYESWPDAYGNQSGSVCTYTAYPELDSGTYVRKNVLEGGIGKACSTDTDCATGYQCNNSTDMFGKNLQQTGYCAQVYACADGKTRFVGYPYNSGIPNPPPPGQNNNGKGYSTLAECKENALATQRCQALNGVYYATYPGYCPVNPSLREGNSPQGALAMASKQTVVKGFEIPAFATNLASTMGNSMRVNELASLSNNTTMNTPFQYEMNINPRPK